MLEDIDYCQFKHEEHNPKVAKLRKKKIFELPLEKAYYVKMAVYRVLQHYYDFETFNRLPHELSIDGEFYESDMAALRIFKGKHNKLTRRKWEEDQAKANSRNMLNTR